MKSFAPLLAVAFVAMCMLFCTPSSAQYMPNRPPGTLLLNMLIKNEAEHLDRTLPRWAKIIDYWIIGVDDANTDNSPEIIQKHLGHIPGEIVIVHFDGMGPTWSILVQHGIDHYPEATHGILADADFMPMHDYLDKMQLDIRCSKHMYTIWTEDHLNERRMDWIYRNIQGAVVKRRTHQILEVPPLPNQEVFQTMIDLHVEEREGGYQDRSGKKNEKYIEWLEKDLLEYPDDTRTLYYLGYAHFDIFNKNSQDPKPFHWDHLEKGVKYFKWRGRLRDKGNQEELWFGLLKLGEIYERFYQDWEQAEYYYSECTKLDPERADAWFYLGQHFRLRQNYPRAIPILKQAAELDMPDRALFQWHFLYACLAKLELARALNYLEDRDANYSPAEWKEFMEILSKARCDEDNNAGPELRRIRSSLKGRIRRLTRKSESNPKVSGIEDILRFVHKNVNSLRDVLTNNRDNTLSWKEFKTTVNKMKDFFKQHSGAAPADKSPSCRDVRIASRSYLKWYESNENDILILFPHLKNQWDEVNQGLMNSCY